MAIAELDRSTAVETLVAGERMTRDEFIRRWESMPKLKRAELIGGTVCMPSPMSQKHGSKNLMMGTWVGVYSAKVPACEGGMDSTWYMLDDSPQPDVFLRMKDHSGGKSWLSGKYLQGAPELVIEVCLSSEGYDLNAKKALYAAAGVVEFAAVLALNRDVKWMYLENGVYRDLKPDADGILRSRTFPGLWLDPVAVVSDDLNRVLEVLARGMKSPEFLEFAARNQPA